MKIKLILITTILLSCGNSSEEIPNKIIPIQEFTAILKDIHLIESRVCYGPGVYGKICQRWFGP